MLDPQANVVGTGGPQVAPVRFDITALLKPRNEAVIESAETGVEDVRLEVHSG